MDIMPDFDLIDREYAVSYTHLDVYKRQEPIPQSAISITSVAIW